MIDQRQKPEQDQDEGPPAWIVSFTDMVTLLLSFFIMLQAFAKMQDPELFLVGRDSFKRAISGMGIAGLFSGKGMQMPFTHRKTKYTTAEAKEKMPRNRVLDAESEEIVNAFRRLQDNMQTRSSDVREKIRYRSLTDIKFAPLRQDLDESAKSYLSNLAIDLKQNLSRQDGITLYVIGMAPDEDDLKTQWRLSAGRAMAVKNYLADACRTGADGVSAPATGGWRFVCWGAGPGKKWRQRLGRIPGKFYIVILITEEGN